MPSKPEVQSRAARAVFTAKGSEVPRKKALIGMNTQGTTNSVGAPTPKACMNLENAGRAIVDRMLSEDGSISDPDEQAEVGSARAILDALKRLQSTLTNPTPEQLHDITIIRASANSLIRAHGQDTAEPLGKDFFRDLDPTQ